MRYLAFHRGPAPGFHHLAAANAEAKFALVLSGADFMYGMAAPTP